MSGHTAGGSVPINLLLADVRQALFDEAKSDPAASASFRYEAGRAVGLMGNAMDTIGALMEAVRFLLPRVDKHNPACAIHHDDSCDCQQAAKWDAARLAIASATQGAGV